MNFEAFTIVALGVLLFGLVSRRLQRSVITPPMAFTCLGVGLGAAGLVPLALGDELVQTLAELTLVLVLFADATRIDLSLLKKQYGLALRLLSVGLPLTILAGTLAGALLFDAFSIWEVALLAAILAPTDAALGQAVVSSERVPVRIRQTLNVESGLNDGLALPVVLFLLSALNMEAESAAVWLRFVSLQLLLAPVVGTFVGYAGGELVDRATRSGWMSLPFTKLSALALSLLAFALAELVGGNGFIAAFVAGLTLGNSKRKVCRQLYEFGETEGQLLTLFVFLIFGAVMVGPALADLSWRILLYALLSLSLVRMLSVALSLVGAKLQLGHGTLFRLVRTARYRLHHLRASALRGRLRARRHAFPHRRLDGSAQHLFARAERGSSRQPLREKSRHGERRGYARAERGYRDAAAVAERLSLSHGRLVALL